MAGSSDAATKLRVSRNLAGISFMADSGLLVAVFDSSAVSFVVVLCMMIHHCYLTASICPAEGDSTMGP